MRYQGCGPCDDGVFQEGGILPESKPLMKLLELKWGCLIGLAAMLWLYVSFFLGLHTDGIGKIWVMIGVGFVITIVSYCLALRAVVKVEPETSFVEGLRSGAIMAVIAAVIAAVAQFGYFRWINPDWTQYMMEQTRLHYEAEGKSPAEVDMFVESASVNFSLQSYAMQAGMGALVSGFILSAIIMGVVRYFKNR